MSVIIGIVVALFIIGAIISLIQYIWETFKGLIVIAASIFVLFMIYKYLGLHVIIALVSFVFIVLVIKSIHTMYINYLKRKYESLLTDSLNELQIATYGKILKHAKLPKNDLVREVFNNIKYKNCIYQTQKYNKTYYVTQSKRKEQYDINSRCLLRAIETLGMADFNQLLKDANLFNGYFVEEDLAQLCSQNKITKEIITKADNTKESIYKSINIYNKNKSFSNYTCEEIALD